MDNRKGTSPMIFVITLEALSKFITTHPYAPATLWAIVGALFILAELSSPGLFFFISFALGCFASGLISLATQSFELQASAALAVCLVSFFVFSKFLHGKIDTSHAATNIDALINQTAIVTESITPEVPGRVKIRGEEWVAESTHAFEVGTHVKITAIKGNRLVVK